MPRRPRLILCHTNYLTFVNRPQSWVLASPKRTQKKRSSTTKLPYRFDFLALQNASFLRVEYNFKFSQDVVNHLADNSLSPETSPERQTTLDSHVRARIQAELEHLRAEEENVQKQIELALEKENIDREISSAGGESETSEEAAQGDVKNSTMLLGDLEEIRSRVDRFQARRQLSDYPAVKESGEAVVLCYK
jgi:altered-inheritance-of-mitochondria protein 13